MASELLTTEDSNLDPMSNLPLTPSQQNLVDLTPLESSVIPEGSTVGLVSKSDQNVEEDDKIKTEFEM